MATYSGQTTVTTAGTAVKLGTQRIGGPLMVKALPTNTGVMYIGNVAEDVASGNGMALEAGSSAIFISIGDLGQLWVDASVNGEKVAWLMLLL